MGLKLVIADDAVFIREAMKNIFAQTKHEVVGEAVNGEEVVKLAARLKPDLIVMDMVMPEKNGVEATREILAQNSQIKIIACSTIDEKNFVLRAIEAGCRGYLTKPFEAKDLINLVNQVGGI
jgi:two-component system, chemotaxis family, chemotaxis protein CheY